MVEAPATTYVYQNSFFKQLTRIPTRLTEISLFRVRTSTTAFEKWPGRPVVTRLILMGPLRLRKQAFGGKRLWCEDLGIGILLTTGSIGSINQVPTVSQKLVINRWKIDEKVADKTRMYTDQKLIYFLSA